MTHADELRRLHHLDEIAVRELHGLDRGLRGLPPHGRQVAAPPDLPHLRPCRLLRRLTQPARFGTRPRHIAPDHPLTRAWRRLDPLSSIAWWPSSTGLAANALALLAGPSAVAAGCRPGARPALVDRPAIAWARRRRRDRRRADDDPRDRRHPRDQPLRADRGDRRRNRDGASRCRGRAVRRPVVHAVAVAAPRAREPASFSAPTPRRRRWRGRTAPGSSVAAPGRPPSADQRKETERCRTRSSRRTSPTSCSGTRRSTARRSPWRRRRQVTLRGTVGSFREKREAKKAAERVYGVTDVENELKRAAHDRRRAERRRRARRRAAGADAGHLVPATIDAKVNDGEVALTGRGRLAVPARRGDSTSPATSAACSTCGTRSRSSALRRSRATSRTRSRRPSTAAPSSTRTRSPSRRSNGTVTVKGRCSPGRSTTRPSTPPGRRRRARRARPDPRLLLAQRECGGASPGARAAAAGPSAAEVAGRATSTGRPACSATWCERLPSKARARRSPPRVPITITAASISSATSTMPSHVGAATSARGSATSPALARSARPLAAVAAPSRL